MTAGAVYSWLSANITYNINQPYLIFSDRGSRQQERGATTNCFIKAKTDIERENRLAEWVQWNLNKSFIRTQYHRWNFCVYCEHILFYGILWTLGKPTKAYKAVFSPLPPPPQNNSSKEIKNELVCIKRKSSLSWRIIPVAVFLITAVVAVVTSHPDTRHPVDTGHGTPQLEPQPSDTTWWVSDFTTETEPMCHSLSTILSQMYILAPAA